MKEELLSHYNNSTRRKWWQKVLRRRIPYTQLKDRTIIANSPDFDLPDNSIQTAKYHLASFLFFNLFYQFTKPSNIYFLLIGVLQMIPQISVSQGKPTMFFPLAIVVVVSMVKDFVEDWKRHLNDKKENSSQVEVLGQAGFIKRRWASIHVGQIIKIYKDFFFPCDLLLLKHGMQGKTAFIQTKNLDGQTNLKLRKVPDSLTFLRNEPDTQMSNLNIELAYEKPNPFLTTFNGNFKMGEKKYNLEANNIVLRGCSLKINSFAIGLCVYSGHETKIMLNSDQPQAKRSKLEHSLNLYFKLIFLLQIVVTLICSIVYGVWLAIDYNNLQYLGMSPNFFLDSLYTWGSWFISFSNFIPISLLVTVELVRFGQGKILQADQLCKQQGRPSQVQTSSVNEQLGQIQYVLSDKTGTLTQNKMDFKCLYVCGESYGTYTEQALNKQGGIGKMVTGNDKVMRERQEIETDHFADFDQSMSKRLNGLTEESPQKDWDITQRTIKQEESPQDKLKNIASKMESSFSNVDFSMVQKQRLQEKLCKESKELLSLNQELQGKPISRTPLNECFIHLALCHNAICEGSSYTSSSPDEIALVNFAKSMGYIFRGKTEDNQLRVQIMPIGNQSQLSNKRYKLLYILQFSSQRKRMSVICQDINTDEILVLCKGADDIILQRVSNSEEEIKQITDQLISYACQGLRTLVLAQRSVSKDYYEEWNSRYEHAITELGPERLEKIYLLQSQIEKDMYIVGATAIQDKLQARVKETIKGLRKSGMKVWMLTGDKKETAISIGYSCGLIDQTSQKITLDCQAQHAANLINNVEQMLPLIKNDKVTIVSGDLIKRIDEATLQKLSGLLKQSTSVICCRVSPKDKQWLTRLVRQWGTTLAIGDGANDVNMINAAHIGVGVRGIEGSQATRAADFVISEFQTLQRLITYHGLNFYHRNANVCLYILYKNILITLPILCYGPLSMQSATYIYQTWINQFYNVFFTALPIILFGLMDTKYPASQCGKYYYQGQRGQYFNKMILIRQLVSSFVMITFLVMVTYFGSELTISPHGYMIYEEWSGMLIFSVIIITINLRIFTISNQISILQVLFILFGVFSYYFCYFLIQTLLYTDIKNSLAHQVSSPLYWLYITLWIITLQGYQYMVVSYNNLQPFMKTELIGQVLIEMQQSLQNNTSHQGEQQPTKDKQANQKMGGGYAFAQDDQRSLTFI